MVNSVLALQASGTAIMLSAGSTWKPTTAQRASVHTRDIEAEVIGHCSQFPAWCQLKEHRLSEQQGLVWEDQQSPASTSAPTQWGVSTEPFKVCCPNT